VPLARRLARTGTFFPLSLFTWAYLAVLVALLASLIAVWWAPWSMWVRAGVFLLGFLGFFAFAAARGLVCSRALAQTLYSPSGRPTRIEELHDKVQHVICATDLHAGEHVYFSRRHLLLPLWLGNPGGPAAPRRGAVLRRAAWRLPATVAADGPTSLR